MQNFTVPKILAYITVIGSFLFITSCISNVDNSQPSRFQVGMEVQNFDSTFTVGQDTMSVQSVRFVVGDFRFETDGEPFVLNNSEGLLPFESQATNFQNPVVIATSNFPADIYQSLNITFPKAPEGGSGNFDPDFYADGKRYSIIAEGTFNGSSFTYRSERVFDDNSFTLEIQEVPEDDAIFTYLIQTDLRKWFRNGESLYDPANSENSPGINDNIENSFRFEQNSSLGNQSL